MPMSVPNQLILMSDEHTRRVLGCYGNNFVRTPNLDRLASMGTVFTDAYTPAPICVPARAAFATGCYNHVTHHWDNGAPYTGTPSSWGHALQEAGLTVGSIGKLHYRNTEDSVGLDFQINPMHVVNGVGDILGSIRDPLPRRAKSAAMAEQIGPGETSYLAYDRSITESSIEWIREYGKARSPWTLFVSLVTPHFPLIAPEEFFNLYSDLGMMPHKPAPAQEHMWYRAMRDCFCYDNFTAESTRIALASYYGLVSFMDFQIGRILEALDDAGISRSTRVIYTSDHGDNIGERGFWGKSTMFEESVGVPMIISGPGVPSGKVCTTPVSLIDIYPTVLKSANLDVLDGRPGRSLVDLANEPAQFDRPVFSEYHAMGSMSGAFMFRKGKWKLVYFAGMAPELYDLSDDPQELSDLGNRPEFASVRDELITGLHAICDPEEVNERAKADQRALVERHGGTEAVINRGGFGATPPPGEKAEFSGKRGLLS